MARPSRVENALARIAAIPKITEVNKKLMSDYADRMDALSRNPKTMYLFSSGIDSRLTSS